MPTYRADLEYEGTRYHGWQIQANARSVAGELQRAFAGAGGEVAEIAGAGRTDAGVHALRQTAHVRLRAEVDPRKLLHAVNDALPPDIHLLELRRVADRFHARHDAVLRSYLYQIALRRTGLAKRYVWWVRRALDVEAMGEAARAIAGRHDFRAFCERPAEQTSTIVVVERAELGRVGDLLLIRLVASHFLWKMVRRIIGALVRVGAGELPLATWTGLLAGAAAPEVARWTAPPSGLFLERVVYAGEVPLGPLAPAVPVPSRTLPGAAGQVGAC